MKMSLLPLLPPTICTLLLLAQRQTLHVFLGFCSASDPEIKSFAARIMSQIKDFINEITITGS